MACTLAVAILYKHHLYVASVGDSRIYHYSTKKGLQQIFRKSAVHGVNGQGSISNGITAIQHLGQKYQAEIDFYQSEVETDDLVLLCSNGLWRTVRDEQIAEQMNRGKDVETLAQLLVEMANIAGGNGNSSVIVARVM
jgi:serine/threonine protein phosphatase PrpC